MTELKSLGKRFLLRVQGADSLLKREKQKQNYKAPFTVKKEFLDFSHIQDYVLRYDYRIQKKRQKPFFLPQNCSVRLLETGKSFSPSRSTSLHLLNKKLLYTAATTNKPILLNCVLDYPKVYVVGSPNSGKTLVVQGFIRRSDPPTESPWSHYHNRIWLYSNRFLLVDTSSYVDSVMRITRQSLPQLFVYCVSKVDSRLFRRPHTVFFWKNNTDYYANKPFLRYGRHFPISRIENLVEYVKLTCDRLSRRREET